MVHHGISNTTAIEITQFTTDSSIYSASQGIYAHGSCCVVFCWNLVLVDFTHILQGYITGTGAIIWLPQCQWSNPDAYG